MMVLLVNMLEKFSFFEKVVIGREMLGDVERYQQTEDFTRVNLVYANVLRCA